MARRDELDRVARLVKLVEQANVAVPADAEHVGDLLAREKIDNELSTLHARHGRSPFAAASMGSRPVVPLASFVSVSVMGAITTSPRRSARTSPPGRRSARL